MGKTSRRLLAKLFIMLLFCSGAHSQNNYLSFSKLPQLPPNTDYSTQNGLAGAYTGTDEDVLILAGGANFPGKLPWEGGSKVYYDEIFVMTKDASDVFRWERMEEKIPFLSAYGGAVSTPAGLLCFGGNTTNECLSKSWFINYFREENRVKVTPGPELPLPLASFAFAKVDQRIFVAGGLSELSGDSRDVFLTLKMDGGDPADWEWEELAGWEGASRAFACGVSQSNGVHNCFYLFSGRKMESKRVEVLYDAWVYDPIPGGWAQISDGSRGEFPFMAGTAFPLGASSIVFTSGADGVQMKKQMEIEQQLAGLKAGNGEEAFAGEEIESREKELLNHLNFHPGFGSRVIVFNTVTRESHVLDQLPGTGQVTTTVVEWDQSIIIPSGEIRPGVRTPEILRIDKQTLRKQLGGPDVLVIVLYFSVLAWMGYFFSKRQKDTQDYFKGGGRVPWWAAGLSIFGTALSAITFMAIPAKTYATDWSYFMLNMTILMVAPLIIYLFIPFYRKLDVTTAYEYLEKRFNLAVRLLGTLSFVLFQVGRMGVVLFLPSIALNVATGIDIFICIGLMGFISLIYTMMGGIEAVIWTDVMQVIVLLGGALLSLLLITLNIDGGFSTIMEVASEQQKFHMFDLSFSLKQPTLWVMLLGGIFANLTTYGTDQTMVQRYMTTKSRKAANRSVWTNAILTIPATFIFFFVGTALFVFYKTYPAELNPSFQNNDAIFPWYIASQLPAGLSGLLIAGIFAAAMSSLSSSMNSAATAYSTDIHFRFGWSKKMEPLKLARIATLVIGVSGILFGFLMATMDVQSLWDEFQKVLGLIIGSLGGVFLLGVLTRRANSMGALCGIAISIVVQVLVAIHQPVHLLLYSATGVISCFVAGYLCSLPFKSDPRNI